MHGDDFHDGAYGFCQCLVGLLETCRQAERGINLPQPFVVHHKQSIHFVCHCLYSVKRQVDTFPHFEEEGNGDYSDGEDVAFHGFVSDDGCCTGSGAASHPRSDECHFCLFVVYALDGFDIFLCKFSSDFRFSSCSPSWTYLHSVWYRAVREGFAVCVAYHIAHSVDLLAVHVCHSISTSSTHTDNLDDAGVVEILCRRRYAYKKIVVHSCFLGKMCRESVKG